MQIRHKEKLYIGGDYYSAPAVYIKDSTNTWSIYYILRDYLGSITHLANSSDNTVVQELSYDAWDRLRDLALGGFLSPDPFVQNPLFSQNFNRYSYAMNNPMMYVDPDGELWFLIPIVVGGIINWALNGADFTWKGLSYFGVGALAGSSLFAGSIAPVLAGGIIGSGTVLSHKVLREGMEIPGMEAILTGVK